MPFPDGKIRNDDEGELSVAVRVTPDRKHLIINYGKPIVWLGLRKRDVLEFVKTLSAKADEMVDED